MSRYAGLLLVLVLVGGVVLVGVNLYQQAVEEDPRIADVLGDIFEREE